MLLMTTDNKRRVYIAYTGGTIGMQRTAQGYQPTRGFLTSQIRELQARFPEQLPELVVQEYEPLLDSANMMPQDWLHMAEDIERHYDEFDGFVILHGTDTMAYSASALSFMLEDLSKPVIFTGSQIPAGEIRTDAFDNLIGALMIAGFHPVPEVAIYFHNHLYRGNRCQKIDATGFDAFASPNYPPLATVGTHIEIHKELLQRYPSRPFRVQRLSPPSIATVDLFPGFDAGILNSLVANGVNGIILRTYGMGNAPVKDNRLLEALQAATDRGVVVVNCTQCFRGRVDMKGYATGHALLQAGVTSGHDMTAEAALTKLYYLFSAGLDIEAIRRAMEENLRGELDPRPASAVSD
jgi:L-asparaginase